MFTRSLNAATGSSTFITANPKLMLGFNVTVLSTTSHVGCWENPTATIPSLSDTPELGVNEGGFLSRLALFQKG